MIAPSLAACRLGTSAPSRIVAPADAAELAAALQAADRANEAVVTWGGGTLQGSANPPARYDVALVTTHLDAVHAYDPRDLTIGAGAGMTLAALQRTLAEHGQILPLDAPFPERATIGGTLAAGWTGPRRATYGRARDLLIGCTVALSNGTLASSGGMVVKNVTGYDMGKLYVGSHGTLGTIVRANFKVLPAAPARVLAISRFDPELRERLLPYVLALGITPSALLMRTGFAGDARADVIAHFEGSQSSVDRGLRDYRSALGAAGIAEARIVDGSAAATALQNVIDDYLAPAGETSVTLLSRGLPSQALHCAQSIRDVHDRYANVESVRALRLDTIADPLTGDVVARISAPAALADHLVALAAAVRSTVGRAQMLTSRLPADQRVDAWGIVPATIGTMRSLKERFDLHHVLAPGRYVGGI